MNAETALSVVGSYDLLSWLGEGAFSTVYEARDRHSGERVALKRLSRTGPSSLARFKQEFRAVQGIHHPNLVELRELLVHDGAWYIAMELVEGRNLIEYLRRGRAVAFDASELHRVFAQLTEGLMALHAHGVVHRDLKPHNVIVTERERVVLLDFGLIEVMSGEHTTHAAGIGSLEYMAPEQVNGGAIGPAADFYALGVCLYEALAGRSPFAGLKPGEIAQAKTRQMPPSPATHNPAAPAKLTALCMRLLDIDRTRRPDGVDLLRVLEPQPSTVSVLPVAVRDEFTGRARELEQLGASLARACAGEFVLCLVQGESGIGKSVLVDEFVRRSRRAHSDALVVHARCYENELLEFKAFDSAMEELASTLCRLPSTTLRDLLPAQAGLLPRLFPAFAALPSVSTALDTELPADTTAQRVAALQALIQLLCNVARRHRLVIAIDDLQWADRESFRLLELLADASPRPGLLIVATARASHELGEVAAAEIGRVLALPGAERLALQGLSVVDSACLAARLLGPQGRDSVIDMLTAESRGHPLLLAELVHFASSRPTLADRHGLTLTEALRARISGLPPPGFRLMVAVAIAGRPYPSSVFARALAMPPSELNVLAGELLATQLLRRRASHELACHHDRIREVAQDLIREGERKALHAALARAIAEQPTPDLGEIARHHDAAGEVAPAIEAYARAAELALETLAFNRAEQLASRGLELAPAFAALPDAMLDRMLLTRAHALSRAGRVLEAADQYALAARRAQGPAQLRLRTLGATHLLMGLRIEEGVAAARAVLYELGVPLPRSQFGMLVRSSWDEWLSRFIRVPAPRALSPENTRSLMQLEALLSLSLSIGMLDPLAQRALFMRHIRLAHEVAEPSHLARALGGKAFVLAGRVPNDPRVEQWIAQARAIGDTVKDPAIDAQLAFREATLASMRWDYVVFRERLEYALHVVTTRCADQGGLEAAIRVSLAGCWDRCGLHDRLVTQMRRWLAESIARNDQVSMAMLHSAGSGFIERLMHDDPDGARSVIAASVAPLVGKPFTFLQFAELHATMQIELCRGGASAYRWLEAHSEEHARAPALRLGFLRGRMLAYRANAALAACRDADANETAALLKEASQLSTRLSKLKQLGDELRLRAQLAALVGYRDGALRDIRDTRQHSERSGLLLYARAEQYLEGLLEGGEAGAALCSDALAFFERQGWRTPLRAIVRVCPAIDVLLARR